MLCVKRKGGGHLSEIRDDKYRLEVDINESVSGYCAQTFFYHWLTETFAWWGGLSLTQLTLDLDKSPVHHRADTETTTTPHIHPDAMQNQRLTEPRMSSDLQKPTRTWGEYANSTQKRPRPGIKPRALLQ